MKTRVNVFLAVILLVTGLCAAYAVNVFAEGEDSSASGQVQGDVSSDKQQIADQRDAMKSNAQAARQEEKNLRDKMHEAYQSGDVETAKSLREELKTTHQENVQQKQQDIQNIKGMRQEFKEAHPKRPLPPPGRDLDNNPPGPKGGPGTNWENRPGPQGGPGAGPNRGGVRHDKDNNPPGPKGGRGTNWENRPGPQGGPGASPNRRPVGGGPRGGKK